MFADGHDHEAQSRRERASHWAAAKLGHTSMAQAESLHLQCRIVIKDGMSLMKIFRVTFNLRNVRPLIRSSGLLKRPQTGEHCVFTDIHMRTKKIQKHVPCSNEALFINAGEESSKVLVVQLEMAMFWSLSKDREKVADITCCKVVRAGNRNELKDYPGQNVEHRTEGCIHEGDDRSTALVVILFLGKNVAGWKLTTLPNSPWIGLVVLAGQLGNKC